ncbi:MAG: alpha/beta fold hydrolase [Candidatus Paceibacterota bacterium]
MKIYSVLLVLAGLVSAPGLVRAFDINYADVEDIAGDIVLLKYRTTEGYTFAECSFSGECGERLFGEYVDNNTPELFPVILNKTNYATSVDGTKAVVNFATLNAKNYRLLHSLDGSNATFEKIIPHKAPALRTSISYANDAVVFFGEDGVITRFDVATGTVRSTPIGRKFFPFLSLSEHGNLIAWYDEGAENHVVVDIATGEQTTFSAEPRSYAVFNDSEDMVAYLNDVDGYNKLFVSPLNNPSLARDVSAGDYTVIEYEFIGDVLYYIANTESNPFQWNLYSFDPTTNLRNVVDSDVAYDDSYGNLKKTHTALLYEKVSGRNKDVVVYEPATESFVRLRASDVQGRELNEEIKRENIEIAGVPAVLFSPEKTKDDTPLIVWLHGGPMRQTSIGFHPFYGYAVYDEMLERFAEDAYVLKLDYTGSWGHGNDHREALKNHIGDRDVSDVLLAIEEMKDDFDISRVHLFGASYGGYLALRTLVEAPQEVASVVSIAGVTDWTSLITRIPSSIFTSQFSGTPNALNTSQYARASVRDRLGEIDNQEILLIYGEDDATVPTWQSKEFYAYARGLDKNAELVGFEEEGHTILKKENLLDVCRRTAETFDLSTSLCQE